MKGFFACFLALYIGLFSNEIAIEYLDKANYSLEQGDFESFYMNFQYARTSLDMFKNGWICPSCGKSNDTNSVCCRECGHYYNSSEKNEKFDWLCGDCGKLNKKYLTYCIRCGKDKTP